MKNDPNCLTYVLTALFIIIFSIGHLGFISTVAIVVIIFSAISLYNSTKESSEKPPIVLDKFLATKEVGPIKTFPPKKVNDLTIEEKFIKGIIKNDELKQIKSSQCLFVNLICSDPIDISAFLNNNKTIEEVIITGPFYFKTTLTHDLRSLKIYNNKYLYDCLRKTLNVKIKILAIYSSEELSLNESWFNGTIEELEIHSPLQQLPSLKKCAFLRDITIRGVVQNDFPTMYLNIPSLIRLNLAQNKFNRFSNILPEHNSTVLEYINVSDNLFRSLPSYIFRLKSLKQINLSSNPLRHRFLRKIRSSQLVKLDYNQKSLSERIIEPTTYQILKYSFFALLIFVPYHVFDSITGSILFSLLIFIYFISKYYKI